MQKQLSLGVKLGILALLALLFGATMISLSVRNRASTHADLPVWGNDKRIERSFSVQSGGRLVIDADEGNISVSGTGSDQVSVVVSARGSEERLQRYDLRFDQEGNTIKIQCRDKRRYFGFFDNQELDVQYTVKVPASFNLDLHTSGGNIDVSDVDGRLEGETSGGDLDLASLKGHVRMSTSGGNVKVQKSDGDVYVETSGGSMTGDLITGTIHMETSGGNIDLRECDGKLYASTSGGNIRVSMKDNKGINLSTSGGNVTVDLPKTVRGDVSAEASGGDVSCDLDFSGKIKEGRMNGKINGGGDLIKLQTSGGDIVISEGG